MIALSRGDTEWAGTAPRGPDTGGSSTEEFLFGSWVRWVILLRRGLREMGRSSCLDDVVPIGSGLGHRSARAR